jgi:hypothetical protein
MNEEEYLQTTKPPNHQTVKPLGFNSATSMVLSTGKHMDQARWQRAEAGRDEDTTRRAEDTARRDEGTTDRDEGTADSQGSYSHFVEPL